MGKVPGVTSGRGASMCAGIHFEEDGIVLTDFNMSLLLKLIFDLESFHFKQACSYKDACPL